MGPHRGRGQRRAPLLRQERRQGPPGHARLHRRLRAWRQRLHGILGA